MKYAKTTQKCKPIISVIEDRVMLDMLESALAADNAAVALAAPQIHWNKRAFAVRMQSHIGGLYINPEYTWKSAELETSEEGCRSYPDDPNVTVTRHKSVTITYLTHKGNALTRTFHGYAARIVQHEMDHLEGKDIHS